MKRKGKKEEKVKKKANERERDNKETPKRDCAVYVSLGRFISLTGGSSFRAYGPAHPGARAGGIAAPGRPSVTEQFPQNAAYRIRD
jgi:hypothetical protein